MFLFPQFNSWMGLFFFGIYFLVVFISVMVVLRENRNPIRSIAWILALIFLPFIGLIFYLFFGRSMKGMHMISRHNKRKLMDRPTRSNIDINNFKISDTHRQLVKLCFSLCKSPLTVGNKIKIFTDGKTKFEALEEDLMKAKTQILIQYYIISDDDLGSRIADILCLKAAEGVSVKVLYDHVGSFSARTKFFRRMTEAGVKVRPFFKVTFPQFANRINWRNHRKVVVIDQTIGYIGGMNIADRYITGPGKGEIWRDTHYRITGDIIQQLYYSFMIDWNFKNKEPDIISFRGNTNNINSETEDIGMQFVHSGPVDAYNSLTLIFVKAISLAKKSIFIQTPYFLPTESLLSALETAALAKVDVRIMIPAKSDSRMLQLASYSYISQCLKSGIKFYLYKPGMLHAKTLIIDDDIVSTGSTNFDFRSFENNFECNIMVYDNEFNHQLKDIFFDDIKHCKRIKLTQWKNRPLLQRASESIIRLLAPIL